MSKRDREYINNFRTNLSSLSEKVQEYQGKPVLLVNVTEDDAIKYLHGHGHHGCFGGHGNWKVQHHKYSLGILDGQLPEVEDVKAHFSTSSEMKLPTKKHISKRDHFDKKWEVNDGGIPFPDYTLVERLGIFQLGYVGRYPGANFILFGDEEVEGYFSLPHDCVFGYIEKLRNGGMSEEDFDRLKVVFKDLHSDVRTYVSGLKLLGYKAPEEFEKVYDAEILKEKEEIIRRLIGLKKEEGELLGIIRGVEQIAESGSDIIDDVAAVLTTVGERDRVDDIRRTILGHLDRAQELEMYRGDFKVTLERGIDVNVPDYLSSLREESNLREERKKKRA